MTHLKFPTFSRIISQRLVTQLLNAHAIDNTDNVKFTIYLWNSVSQTIVLTPPLSTKILNIIKSLNPNIATGYDNISSFFLRLGDDVLASKLSLCFSTARIWHISSNF